MDLYLQNPSKNFKSILLEFQWHWCVSPCEKKQIFSIHRRWGTISFFCPDMHPLSDQSIKTTWQLIVWYLANFPICVMSELVLSWSHGVLCQLNKNQSLKVVIHTPVEWHFYSHIRSVYIDKILIVINIAGP